ncbi:MAG: hypothetical protein A3A33_02130 [Candidatus Yanofskybacteria bacterium RIFCSPLOWO2_01_FULL_49_25]|uniref:Ribulose-phosphate 3-epimerase n=1 Tax=Candidatus Yanofskybacteria bacterium RIFCSPLOWO2_01_FULL_49_25 TaxID=1802701 RepID=A0A1F8GT21_9BACT|nr:MAG: hypothetical protein A3A33_02130 [Candidatus Yanofskybacteria bacterium RIFCSPLOWO2_01_FULL_49_25]
MIEILPSILVKTKAEFEEKVRMIEPHCERAHLDIADGIFVPNKTIDGFLELEQIETDLLFTVHLMVSKPENHIARWLETPADSFIFHTEATQKHIEVINAIKEGECEVGIALNPSTPHTAISEWVDLVDFVHFMTVEPGFYGGEFVDSVVDKIKDFHYFYPDKPIRVDGDVTPETAPKLVGAGETTLVVGHYLYTGNLKDQISKIKNAIEHV